MPNEFILQQTSIPEKKYNSQTLVGMIIQIIIKEIGFKKDVNLLPNIRHIIEKESLKIINTIYNYKNDFFKSNQNWLNYQKQQNDQFLTTHQRAFKAPKEQTKTDLFPSIVKKSLPTKDPKELSEYSSKWTTAPHYWDRTYADHQQNFLNQVRFGDQSQRQLPKKTHIDIYCYRHPDKIIHQGCVALNCQKMIMCSQCNFDDRVHWDEHRDQIVEFEKFLEILTHEIKRVNKRDSMLYNENVKKVLENEHSILIDYDQICKMQIKKFNVIIDEHVSALVHHFQIMKQSIAIFFEKQYNAFTNNMAYFKTQYLQMNPEETISMFGDVSSIIAKLHTKTPHQCYQFLNNLRKSANMEGQLLADLDYISQLVLSTQKDKTYLIQDYTMSEIKQSIRDMIEQTRTILNDSLKLVPRVNTEIHSNIVSQGHITYSRNQIKLSQSELFDKIKFRFTNVTQIQTHHSNSVSAIVALSDDIIATSSYDRTIKIWKLSTGTLIKTLNDTNCISCMITVKIKNDKNPQAAVYTDDDNLKLTTALQQGKLSDAGFLLATGGLDRTIKVWDFDLKPEPTNINRLENSLLSQPYNITGFPLHVLKGHNGWITSICSLEDEKNIAAGDDTGEIIIWDIINQMLMFRLTYVRNPGLIPFISLTIPQNQFVSSSGTILRVYQTYYKTDEFIHQTPPFKMRLEKKFAIKKDPIQFSPQLTNAHIQREIDIGWQVLGCLTPQNYHNLLVVYGYQPHKMKYVLLNNSKQIEITTDCDTYVGHMIMIEKHRISMQNNEIDQFYKYINFILCGDKQLALYDGYGTKIRALESDLDDLYSSNTLCQRNMQILKLDKKGAKRSLKMVCVSQYGTEIYTYKSSRITQFEIQYDYV
ncbi:hypothetical protein pb186bvf_011593 [Paramecium bursaria]